MKQVTFSNTVEMGRYYVEGPIGTCEGGTSLLKMNEREGSLHNLSKVIEAWFKVHPSIRDDGIWLGSPEGKEHIEWLEERDMGVIRSELYLKIQGLKDWKKVILWSPNIHVERGTIQEIILNKFYDQFCEWTISPEVVDERYIRAMKSKKILDDLEKEIESMINSHAPIVIEPPKLYRHPVQRSYGIK